MAGYCRICGNEKGTWVVRFWEPDDGWVIGALCECCEEDYGPRQPQEGDFAYHTQGEILLDNYCTDEDTPWSMPWGLLVRRTP